MQAEFLSKFSNNIDKISLKSAKTNLLKLIHLLELAEN